ncbi:MAG: asparaginase domain-containing protein [Patescibacteria group bacterium]
MGRVALLLAGGTALTNRPSKGNVIEKATDVPLWVKQVQELRMVADFEPYFLFGENDVRVGPKEFVALAESIKELYDEYDGIVIVHHLQNIEYAIAAISLMIQQPGKPIIFTSSPYALHGTGTTATFLPVFSQYHGLGVKANLLNALHIAVSDIRGVLFMFGNRLMSGLHVDRSTHEAMNPFTTIGDHTYGGVDFGLRLTTQRGPRRSTKKPVFKIGLEEQVQSLGFQPSLALGLQTAIAPKTKAVVLHMDGEQPLDPASVADLTLLAKEKLVVFHGGSSQPVLPPGVIFAGNMTRSMAVVKTMWVLAQHTDPQKAARLLTKNVTGELIKKGSA